MVLEYIFILMIVGFYVVDAFTMYDTCRKKESSYANWPPNGQKISWVSSLRIIGIVMLLGLLPHQLPRNVISHAEM